MTVAHQSLHRAPGGVPVPSGGHFDDGHGDDGRLRARALGIDPDSVLDLSASLNPFAPELAPLAARHLEALRRYPDADDRAAATAALAGALGVSDDRVLVTNGGAEAIALVAGVLGEGWVEDPDFSLYRRHLARVVPGAPRFRSDPHNPTGSLAGPTERAEVWDEAFFPLATGRFTRGDALQGTSVVVGSLTKLFACPGLRIGYVLAPAADPGLIAELRARQPRWSVNGLALASLPDLLAASDLPGWARSVSRCREALVEVLRSHGYAPRPSAANFVLMEGVEGLSDRLAARGIMVRHCASFGLPGAVRIAVPDDSGLARLDRALVAVDRPAMTTAEVEP